LDAPGSVSREILSIQKLIVLLNENTYNTFYAHLRNSNAHLPARLVQTIREKGFDFQSTEELCQLIYQKPASECKNNFYQLSTHSFRLSEFIAINYPNYLLHNLQLMDELIAKQQLAEAQFLAQILLSVAEKINDFNTQMQVLRFMVNQEHIFKQPQKAYGYYEQLKISESNNKALNNIYYLLRNDFNMVNVATRKDPQEILRALDYLKDYFTSSSKSISMMSRYASIYIRFYYGIESYGIEKEIIEFEKELNNHSYILMPYLFDIKTSCSFIRLGINSFNVNDKDNVATINNYKKHYESIGYWKTYLNVPKLYINMLKAQDYLESYSSLLHQTNFMSLVTSDVMTDIQMTSDECLQMIAMHDHSVVYIYDIINLKIATAGLLLLRGGEYIKEGISLVEQSIISFQQMKKSRTIGNSYLILMMGYFMQADYKSCIATYARYIKVSKNRDMYAYIDVKIQIYYNFAHWLSEKEKTSINSLREIYTFCSANPRHESSMTMIEGMSGYFTIQEIIESEKR
jgi:hypothetical protein